LIRERALNSERTREFLKLLLILLRNLSNNISSLQRRTANMRLHACSVCSIVNILYIFRCSEILIFIDKDNIVMRNVSMYQCALTYVIP
jgi:hypothetical protein